MKVSIIIPVYNVSDYIEKCVVSVLGQTYKNIEIIIVDDCTPDDSIIKVTRILHEYTSIDVRIIHHEKNGGLSAARNTGIKNSTGDFLYFLDSDDEISADCIEKLVVAQKKTKAQLVVGNYTVINPQHDYYPKLNENCTYLCGNELLLKRYTKCQNIYMMAWNKLISRKFLITNNLFFEVGAIHEDDIWTFKIMCHLERMAIVKDSTYFYTIRNNSIMTGISRAKDAECRIQIVKAIATYAQEMSIINKRHIHSFIEDAKREILYRYKDVNDKQGLTNFYYYSLTLPRVNNARILLWYFFNYRKLIRDFHYFLTKPDNIEYYWDMPDYDWIRKKIRYKYYCWAILTLIKRGLGLNCYTKRKF